MVGREWRVVFAVDGRRGHRGDSQVLRARRGRPRAGESPREDVLRGVGVDRLRVEGELSRSSVRAPPHDVTPLGGVHREVVEHVRVDAGPILVILGVSCIIGGVAVQVDVRGRVELRDASDLEIGQVGFSVIGGEPRVAAVRRIPPRKAPQRVAQLLSVQCVVPVTHRIKPGVTTPHRLHHHRRDSPPKSYPLRARAGICGTSVGQALPPNVGPLEDDDTHAVDRRVALTQLRSIPRTGPARLHASGARATSDRAAAANTRELLFGSGRHQRRSEPSFLESRWSRFQRGAPRRQFSSQFRAQNKYTAPVRSPDCLCIRTGR